MSNGFDIIYNKFLNGPDSMLNIYGSGSGKILGKMIDRAKTENKSMTVIRRPYDMESFWEQMFTGFIGDYGQFHSLDNSEKFNYYLGLLKHNPVKHNIFIEDMPGVFHALNANGSRGMVRYMKDLWWESEARLRIIGSTENIDSCKYKRTIGNTEFPLNLKFFVTMSAIYMQ